ncbi:MAG: DUF4249 family protein [Bacteroidales bacterium]|nr:DUF4249 family protein [Bacteroidales bacterium]
MKKTFLYRIITLAAILVFAACEEQTSWIVQAPDRFIVADCIITNELKYHELKLYYSGDSLNYKPESVTGATIGISYGTNQIEFTEKPGEPGIYISNEVFMATAGNIYSLHISAGNISGTAYATMTAINPMEPAEIIETDSLYRFVYFESSQPSMTDVFYDWSSSPGYCSIYGACSASETFYTLNNIDINKIFAPDKQEILFPRGTQIIRRKYSLSDEHQKFLRSLLMETEWRGGVFDVEQGNVPTNFSGEIRGWFAACMVLTDTVNFNYSF